VRDHDFHVTMAVLDDRATLVSVRGDVDLATSPTLRRILAAVQACRRHEAGHGRVVVDLSRVTFFDASGLGVLVEAARSAERDGQTLALRDPSPICRRVLEITRLESVFRIDAGAPRCGDASVHHRRRSRTHHARDLDQSA
jgi:anti-sigma B factor antagonist